MSKSFKEVKGTYIFLRSTNRNRLCCPFSHYITVWKTSNNEYWIWCEIHPEKTKGNTVLNELSSLFIIDWNNFKYFFISVIKINIPSLISWKLFWRFSIFLRIAVTFEEWVSQQVLWTWRLFVRNSKLVFETNFLMYYSHIDWCT
jgi:hypothetical protein